MIMPENLKKKRIQHKKMHHFLTEMVHSHLMNIQSRLLDCTSFLDIDSSFIKMKKQNL